MRDLRLRVLALDEHGLPLEVSSYDIHSFPGLMTLGNRSGGWPGFLHLLRGPTELRTLRGSFYVNAHAARKMITGRELGWMKHHWTNLENAEFFQDDGNIGPVFSFVRRPYGVAERKSLEAVYFAEVQV
ncbi:hypothetical protein BGX29_003054 [Mortierella sp. GBA35]|nr:hypothetical protein BGX29_003054 [Mortierella sp. GBA35]